MNSIRRASGAGVVAMGLVLCLAGCVQSRPTHQYTLLPLAPAGAPGVTTALTLGVGPVRMPQYLRQSAMVRRVNDHRVTYGDFDIWADPVENSLVEVLVENLSRLTGARRVVRHPWRIGDAPDRRIALAITAFELATDGQAELVAHWEIRDPHGVLLDAGRFSQREPAHGEISALPEALSRALLALSRDLAAAVTR